MKILIRDGLYLQYGYLEVKMEVVRQEQVMTTNMYGEVNIRPNDMHNFYKVLRAGNGITIFKNEEELERFLRVIGTYTMYDVSMINQRVSIGG